MIQNIALAILTPLCGALLYLWHRAASQPPGEYRVVGASLPSRTSLATDLYAVYRRAKPVAVDGASIPLALAGCSDEVQRAWMAVAERVEELAGPPKVPPSARRIGPAVRVPSVAGLVALGLCACTPLQRQVAQQRAAAGALDFAACAGTEVPQPLINGLASAIDGRDTWRADLIGAGGAAVRCGLLALVRQLTQDAPGGEAGVAARRSALSVDPAAQVQQLAQKCEAGPCTDLRERAAWLLAKGGAK